jgi:CBS domain-containing protein
MLTAARFLLCNRVMPRLVQDVMTRDVVTLGRNESLRTLDDAMRLGRIRHLPIAGILTASDFVKLALA